MKLRAGEVDGYMSTYDVWDSDEVGWLREPSVIDHSIASWLSAIMSSIAGRAGVLEHGRGQSIACQTDWMRHHGYWHIFSR